VFSKLLFTAGYIKGDVDDLLSVEDIDPEVRPGLFQGDMAMNNEVSTLHYCRSGPLQSRMQFFWILLRLMFMHLVLEFIDF